MADKEIRIRIAIEANGAQAALTGIADDMKKVKDSAESTGTSVGGFNSAVMSINNAYNQVSGAIGVLASGFKSIGDAIHAGEDVGAVSAAFVAISGSAQEAARTLELMNAATGNTISNMQLMQTASRMFSMGLASSGDQAARLTELAVKLGGAMGNDASTSIENFTMLLANQSVKRLDTFGLSVDVVKKRMEELKAQGISTQEAFTMAVMEQGAAKLKTLGDAANASLTPLKQLEKTVGDVKDSLLEMGAANVNDFIGKVGGAIAYTNEQKKISAEQARAEAEAQQHYNDELAQSVEYINDMSKHAFGDEAIMLDPNDIERNKQLMEAYAQYQKTENKQQFAEATGTTGMDDRSQQILLKELETLKFEFEDVSVFAERARVHAQALLDAKATNKTFNTEQDDFEARKDAADASLDHKKAVEQAQAALKDYDVLVKQTNDDFKSMGKDFKGEKVFSPEDVALIKEEATFAEQYFDTYIQKGYEAGTITKEHYEASLKQVDALKQLAENAANTGDAYKAMNNAISDAKLDMRGIGKMKSQAGDFAGKEGAQFQGLTLFDDKEIARLDQYKASVDETLARVEEAHAQGLITDEDYENAKKSADAVSKLADDAHRSAEAFSKMNLNQLMGQVDGGVVGEIGDKIMENFKGTKKEKAEAQKAFDLASGRETQTSLAMADAEATLAKLAKSKGGVDAAIEGAKKLDEFLKASREAGLTDEQIAAGVKGMMDQTTDTKKVALKPKTVTAGDDVAAALKQLGVNPADVDTSMAGDATQLKTPEEYAKAMQPIIEKTILTEMKKHVKDGTFDEQATRDTQTFQDMVQKALVSATNSAFTPGQTPATRYGTQVTDAGMGNFNVQDYVAMIAKYGHIPNMEELAASQKQDKQALDQSSALAGMDSEYIDTKGGKGKGKGKDDKSTASEETKAMVKDTEQIKLNTADSAKSLGLSAAHLAAGHNDVKGIVQGITTLTSKSHKVDLEVVLSGKAAALLDQLLALSKNNGGVSPGTSPRGSNPWKD